MQQWKSWAGHPGFQYDTSKVDWPQFVAVMIAAGMIKQTEEQEDKTPAPIPAEDQCPYDEIVNAFNDYFHCSNRLTVKRRHSLKCRWRDPAWRERWHAAIFHGAQSNFLRGQNDRGWRIDLEFFCRPDTVDKILEGKYDNRKTVTKHAQQQAGSIQAIAEAIGIRECLGAPMLDEKASCILPTGSHMLDCVSLQFSD